MQRSGMRGEMAIENAGERQSPSLTRTDEAVNLPCRCRAAKGAEHVPKSPPCPLNPLCHMSGGSVSLHPRLLSDRPCRDSRGSRSLTLSLARSYCLVRGKLPVYYSLTGAVRRCGFPRSCGLRRKRSIRQHGDGVLLVPVKATDKNFAVSDQGELSSAVELVR